MMIVVIIGFLMVSRNVSFILGQIGYFALEGRVSETFRGVVCSNVRLVGANKDPFFSFSNQQFDH